MAESHTETLAYNQHGYTTKHITVVASAAGGFTTKDKWLPGAVCVANGAGGGAVTYSATTNVFTGASYTADSTVYIRIDGILTT